MLKNYTFPVVFVILLVPFISCSSSKTQTTSKEKTAQSARNDTAHQQIDTSSYKQSIQHAVEEKLLPKYKKK